MVYATEINRAPTLNWDGMALVLAPHPDDESLACGAFLASAFAGDGAHVVCLTDGAASHPGSAEWPPQKLAERRRGEVREAVVRLGGGPGDVTFLGLPDGHAAAADGVAAAKRLGDLIGILDARLLLSPVMWDRHPDHVAAARLAHAVAAPRPALRWLGYSVWAQWEDRPAGPPTRCDLVHSVTPELRRRKARAVAAHASQRGRIVADAPDGFVLPKGMARRFITRDEWFVEIRP